MLVSVAFHYPKKACKRLVELGDEKAQRELKIGDKHSYVSYYHDISRHNPLLVQVVEELGDEASGSCAKLRITNIYADQYRIEEYDGRETIEEPGYDRGGWISVK